jgi:hypothetical protein
LIEISVYLPGPDLCNAFLQPALKLLQFFQWQVAHRIANQVPFEDRIN